MGGAGKQNKDDTDVLFTSKMELRAGTKLEALDYTGNWFPAKILKVKVSEKEVLVHFDKWSSRFDVWLPHNSPKIRPLKGVKKKEKEWRLGDRIIAKWGPAGKTYPATISKIVSESSVEVIFYDGFKKVVSKSSLKLDTEKLYRQYDSWEPRRQIMTSPATASTTTLTGRSKRRLIEPVSMADYVTDSPATKRVKPNPAPASDNERGVVTLTQTTSTKNNTCKERLPKKILQSAVTNTTGSSNSPRVTSKLLLNEKANDENLQKQTENTSSYTKIIKLSSKQNNTKPPLKPPPAYVKSCPRERKNSVDESLVTLIKEVEKYPQLWHVSTQLSTSLQRVDNAWNAVASATHWKVEHVKQQWCDIIAGNFNYIGKSTGNSYSQYLSFLRNQNLLANSKTKVHSASTQNKNPDPPPALKTITENSFDVNENEYKMSESKNGLANNKLDDNKNNNNTENASNNKVILMRGNCNEGTDYSNDSDMLFCLSLVKTLKRLTPKKNRQARMKIEQALYNVEYDEDE